MNKNQRSNDHIRQITYDKNKDLNNSIKIIHWNGNSIYNKLLEFKQFIIDKYNPDLISISETKLSEFRANAYLIYNNYNVIHKARDANKNGAGGVAMLIKKDLQFVEIQDPELNKLEMIGINIHTEPFNFIFVTYYNPPLEVLNTDIIQDVLLKRNKNIILCGDLNAKSTNFHCKSNNKNGDLLENLILNSNLMVANNNEPIYYRTHNNSYEIFDWCLISSEIYHLFVDFEVLKDNKVDSDHYPFMVKLCNPLNKISNKNNNNNKNQNDKIRLNYNKTDWIKVKEELSQPIQHVGLSIDELNELIIKTINKACDKHTPAIKQFNDKPPLPQYIVDMITHKKSLKSNIKKLSKKSTANIELIKLAKKNSII
jgi:hypothetical protein